jgi:membrane associated rhomboid family serine protease
MVFRRRYPFTHSLTFLIIVLTIVVWILQIIFYPFIDEIFALNPKEVLIEGKVYQFATYMFLHATYIDTNEGAYLYPNHLFFNMFVFAIFGFSLEQVLGRKKFLMVYLISGIGSAIFYIFATSLIFGMSETLLLGASGAVFGVLAAYAFRFPTEWVYMLGFFPMPASIMIIILLIEETFFGLLGLQPGVANFGHVGGIITGLILMVLWKFKERMEEKKELQFEYVWE